MWERVIDELRRSAAANAVCRLRRGNVIHLPDDAELIIAGDLHGHGQNLLRIQALAGDLPANPRRHVILQELIHRTPDAEPEAAAPPADTSHHVLTRVARWQLAAPGQVHVILGNHELAQMTGQDILKWGSSICRSFAEAVEKHYGDEAADALSAMNDYFHSLPLAARRDGLAVVHSLPAERHLADFDAGVLDRPLSPADLARTGSVYRLVWGRSFGRASIDVMKAALNARLLVLGHQPQPTGVQVLADDAVIIASDHAQGVVLRLAGGELSATAVELASRVVPLAGVGM